MFQNFYASLDPSSCINFQNFILRNSVKDESNALPERSCSFLVKTRKIPKLASIPEMSGLNVKYVSIAFYRLWLTHWLVSWVSEASALPSPHFHDPYLHGAV